MIALHNVVHNNVTWGSAIVTFIQMTFGGVGIGIVFGIVFAYWLNTCVTDVVKGVLITIFGAWITFFVSEFVLHTSGILALEFFGLYLSSWAKPNLVEEVQHAIHSVWGILTYCVETLLYIIVGLYIGKVIGSSQNNIHTFDLWKLIAFFFFVYAIRFIV